MRPLRFDDGTHWDDPNAYWGDPGYVLELGDPGYVPPPPPSTPTVNRHHKPKNMSSNATPENRNVLLALAKRIHAGQLAHGASVGLHHHLAADMDAAIKKLEGDPAAAPGSNANKGSQLVYRDAIAAAGDAEAARAALSNGAVKTWLDGYRTVIEGIHGKKPDDGWVSAGFPTGSTAVPRNHDARQNLLSAARAYLAAHPTFETTLPQASGPGLAITAAQALALSTQLQTAVTLISTTANAQFTARGLREADVDALYEEVSATIAELRDLLEDDDARWELFGLNIPANPTPPLGVASLTLTSAGTGRELAAWTYAVRAEHYRLFLKRVGVDADFVNVADPVDLEHTLKDLTPGSTIEVYIVPANDGGEGPASPTVSKVVGA